MDPSAPRLPFQLLVAAMILMPVSSAVAGILVLVAAAQLFAWRKRCRPAPLVVTRWWGPLLGAIALSCLFSSHAEISWISMPLSMAYLLALWTAARAADSEDRIRKALAVLFWSTLPWCVVAMAVSVLHLRDYWHWGPLQLMLGTQDDRAVAIFGHPNFLAGYLLMTLGAGLAIAPGSWRLYGGPLLLMAACQVMTQSRSAWIGTLVLGLLWLLGWSAGSATRGRLARWVLAAGTLTMATVFGAVPFLRNRLMTLFNPDFASNLGHERVWRSALAMIRSRPLFGWGPGTWYRVYPAFRDPAEFEDLPHAHSVYLQIGAEYGLVVLVLLLGLFARIAWRAIRSTRPSRPLSDLAIALASTIAGYMAMGLFEFTLSEGRNSIAFFSILGFLVSLSTIMNRKATTNAASCVQAMNSVV
ncbi:MAG: O-antigen ligase family protein [Cyanobacteria bacterium REEB65]|nr:O-antigen ligase family protein [Cyanobacteria bacterium REEB65]